ncbi:Transposase and inactivated derivatives [Suttonella ornithocola]|uniref:Transposase and inactivated derivatives n=1 Tax=Suttonella ornithocola TaxID=279832 RepID=A0A380N0V7_9GAMM|nr:Transposase and inactivated derivatives [Suttonella ornithocola]
MPKVPVINELDVSLRPADLPNYQTPQTTGSNIGQASSAGRAFPSGSHIAAPILDRSRLQGDPGALSSAVGQAGQRVGQIMQDIALDMQQKANAVRVSEAQNEYIAFLQDQKYNNGVILGKVELDSVIYSDGWRGYNGLVDVGYAKHFRVDHGNNEFAHGHCHINGIESFWSFTKRRLSKFNGVTANFELYLKECKWRWNQNSFGT